MIEALSANQIRELLSLQPLAGEGGAWAPIYRQGEGNAIYFLLEENNFSSWHRLLESETWILLAGAPVALHTISDQHELHLLNRSGEKINLTHTIAPQVWMAAKTLGPWSLLSCLVIPAFSQMELATRAQVEEWGKKYGEAVGELFHE